MSILSEDGDKVLAQLFRFFREDYLGKNPGCDENAIERAFLYSIMKNAIPISEESWAEDEIDKIS